MTNLLQIAAYLKCWEDEENKPYFIRNKVFGIFNATQLLKTLRRNLMKNNIVTPRGTVSSEYKREFNNLDQGRPRKLA